MEYGPKIVVNAATGEQTEAPLTDEEIADRETMAAAEEQTVQQRQQTVDEIRNDPHFQAFGPAAQQAFLRLLDESVT